MTIFETERLNIDEVAESEIDEVIEIESHKENRDYLWIRTVDEHKAEIADPNHMLLIFHEKTSGETKGYALIRLDFKSHIFEVRRIAITDKGRGYGKESMLGLIRYAFEQTETNRLWLDVYPDNEIGIKMYESLGIVNVNIKMIKKWKIKMYICQELFLSLCFHKGPFLFQTV